MGSLGPRGDLLKRATRYCVGLQEIAGYGHNLVMGLRETGRSATLLTLSRHPFAYGMEENISGLVALTFEARENASKSKFAGYLLRPFLLFLRVPLLFHAMVRYDRFVFLYNDSFLWNLDLPLFRLFRKKVIVVFVGTDVRPAFMNGGIFGDGTRSSLEFGIRKMRNQKLKVRLAEIFSNKIISNAAISQYQHEDFVDWFWIGIPMEKVAVLERGMDITGRIRILHSPSDPLAKGTEKIRAMVDRMIAKGYPIDYTEIKGRPHNEVVEELRRTDLVIDQLYSDSPMATFAAEAAMYGVPALIGGYYAGHISNDGHIKKVPTIYCHPDSMEVTLEELLQHPDRMRELGKRARTFVSEEWERGQVAKRIVKIFDGELEEEHILSPYDNDYILGSGLSQDVVAKLCIGILKRRGEKGFRLMDKPRLMQNIFKLINDD